MSSGNKQLAQSMERQRIQDRQIYEQSRQDAKELSPAERRMEEERKAHQTWKDGKDYRKPAPGMISLSYADPAQRQRMRERVLSLAPTGVSALGAGGANGTALEMARMNMLDEYDRDAATAYEGDLRAEDEYVRTGVSPMLMSQDFARRQGLLNSAANMSQFTTQARINSQPQSLLPGILAAGLGATGQAFQGSLSLGGLFNRSGTPSASQLANAGGIFGSGTGQQNLTRNIFGLGGL